MASKRRLRRRACEGKKVYASSQAAHGARAALGHWDCIPYPCKFCGGFHLGRPSRAQRDAWRARKAAS